MSYHEIAEMVPVEKIEKLSARLIDFVLKSKNADKMPSSQANTLLRHWQDGPLTSKAVLAAILEAAVLVESDKTRNFLEEELKLPNVVKALKTAER